MADDSEVTAGAGDDCPACGVPVAAGDRYCEACGHDLGRTGSAAAPQPTVSQPATGQPTTPQPTTPQPTTQPTLPPAPSAGQPRWLTSAAREQACAECGGTAFGPEGYCDHCGQRRASAEDHTELELGVLAAVTDRGLRHHRNEDAVGIGAFADWLVAVVCDGVSSSDRPDVASTGAVGAALPALLGALRDGDSTVEAIAVATRAAQAAAALVAGAQPGRNPPSTTFVCAVVRASSSALSAAAASDSDAGSLPGEVTVGWVGDSRAYWVPADGTDPTALTTDDALGNALLRWLGADARDTEPRIHSFIPDGPGRVLVCSDGLFKYRPSLHGLISPAEPRRNPADGTAEAAREPGLATARALIQFALGEGGADNITAALIPYGDQTTSSNHDRGSIDE